jgi:hypothetical protein
MYERRGEKILPFPRFLGRMGLSFLLILAIVAVALCIGIMGYHYIAGLGWIDAELNAAMILSGMGPVDPMKTTPAKFFASGYALFSAVVFLTSVGIILSPVLHRIVHRFNLDSDEQGKKSKPKNASGSNR